MFFSMCTVSLLVIKGVNPWKRKIYLLTRFALLWRLSPPGIRLDLLFREMMKMVKGRVGSRN